MDIKKNNDPNLTAELTEFWNNYNEHEKTEKKQQKKSARKIKALLGQKNFTEKQLEALSEAVKGMTYKDIGINLLVSENAIKKRFQRIFKTYGFKNKAQAFAIILGY